MNKQQFIRAFAEKANFTQKDAGITFDAMASTVIDALKAGEKIQIAGFGTYELRKRPAREGINPQTKQKVKIPAQKVPSFKFGNSFKGLFN